MPASYLDEARDLKGRWTDMVTIAPTEAAVMDAEEVLRRAKPGHQSRKAKKVLAYKKIKHQQFLNSPLGKRYVPDPRARAAYAKYVNTHEPYRSRLDLSDPLAEAVLDLAYNPAEARDAKGRWTGSPATALKKAIHGDVEDLEAMVRADRGPTRIHMPQLSGVPLPGSKADALPHAPGQEVDLTSQFEKELRARGVSVQDTSVPVADLKPTQDQLVMSKVAGLANFMLTAPKDSPVFEPIFVSADNHVIDGHHRWAGRSVVDRINGISSNMDVRKVGLNIEDALKVATEFMDEWGLPRAGMTGQKTTVSNFAPSLSNEDILKAAIIDLAFDPHEARDAKGRWTDSALGGAPAALQEALASKGKDVSLESLQALLSGDEDSYSSRPTKKPTYREVADDMGWDDMDVSGGFPQDKASIHQEHQAQIDSEWWASNVDDTSPDDDQYAASLWQQYQNPGLYGKINYSLRNNVREDEGPDPDDLRRYAKVMFDRGGTTLKKPMTVYRALRTVKKSKTTPLGHDWAKELKPGTVFSDKGIVSTTAHGKFAQGWLGLTPTGQEHGKEKPDDVVVEIRLPAGQRIVGGSTQFIETMLPPGTEFKVLSSEKRQATDPRNPLGDHGMDPFTYTHVVAEVVKS